MYKKFSKIFNLYCSYYTCLLKLINKVSTLRAAVLQLKGKRKYRLLTRKKKFKNQETGEQSFAVYYLSWNEKHHLVPKFTSWNAIALKAFQEAKQKKQKKKNPKWCVAEYLQKERQTNNKEKKRKKKGGKQKSLLKTNFQTPSFSFSQTPSL